MKSASLLQKLSLSILYLLIVPILASAAPTGSYYGSVTITTPADMGSIDLALYLNVVNTDIQHETSYIVLEKTILFPAGEPLDGKEVGPRLTGTFSQDTFSLYSDDFTSMVGNKEVTRQITLNSAIIENDGQSISGIYTETVTGLLPEDIIISGEFVLLKPVPLSAATFEDSNGDNCLDLDEIRAGGNDPNLMEFRDASGALSVVINLGIIPLCPMVPEDGQPEDASPEETAKRALQEYYDSQN
jgi:hypothetical protein